MLREFTVYTGGRTADAMKQHSIDPMTLYMREVARYKLLSAEDEIALARRIARGDESARHEMINSNLRLVVKIARRYSHRGLPLSDLIEEGNIGLMRAAEKFDEAHGCRFSTYATWWIRQAVDRAVMNQSRTIRLPVHIGKEFNAILRVTNTLRTELGREPRVHEIAEHIGKTEQRVQALKEANIQTESADQLLHSEGDFTLYDVTEDEHAKMPSAHMESSVQHDLLGRWLSHLTGKEREVMRLRFGLGANDEPWTLDAIGKHLGVTRERIRQIQVASLQKLRLMIERDQLTLEEVL